MAEIRPGDTVAVFGCGSVGQFAIATAVNCHDRFAKIVTIEQISRTKPAPDAYIYCLKQLGIKADAAIAIEDTPVSMAALAAT